MRILAQIFKEGRIHCIENCQYKHTCANHESSSDVRCEKGFSPELYEENNKIYCRTKEEPLMIGTDGVFPSNVKTLKVGAVVLHRSRTLAVWCPDHQRYERLHS